MKVMCIDNSIHDGFKNKLTYGKIYECVIDFGSAYSKPNKFRFSSVVVVNDIGEEKIYKAERFITLDEWRELQINKIIE